MTVSDFIREIENAYGSYAKADRPGMKVAITNYLEQRHVTEKDLSRLLTYILENISTLYGSKVEVATLRKAMITLGIISTGPPEYKPVDYEKPIRGENCPERREFLTFLTKLRETHGGEMAKAAKRTKKQESRIRKQEKELAVAEFEDGIPF